MIDTNKYAVKCFQDEAQAILDMIPRLDDNFSKAVDLILNCKGKLIVTGVGKSGHVGEKIAATLASLGTPSFFLNPLDAYHGDLGMIAKGDVVMAISYSGNTDELLRFIPLLIKREIPIIGVSGNSDSLLAKFSECHLDIKVNHEADPLNLAPTSSTTCTMAMGDALACALVKLRNFKSEDFAQFHPGGSLGKKLLTRVRDVMHKDNLPILRDDIKLMDALVIISDGKLGLAVVLHHQKVIGLVTSGDIRRVFQKFGVDSFNLKVKDFMTKTPKCIYDDSWLSEADLVFKDTKVKTLVVINRQDEFVGYLDYSNCSI